MQTETETFKSVCRFQGGRCGAHPGPPHLAPGACVRTAMPAGAGLGRSTRRGGVLWKSPWQPRPGGHLKEPPVTFPLLVSRGERL